jgi:uncharacterized protein YjiK
VPNPLTYQDFDLMIEPGEKPGKYRARVINSPGGPSGPVEFTVPFSADQLENFILKIGLPRRASTRGRPQTLPLKDFGGKLYDAVFQDGVRDALSRSLSQTGTPGAGLRLRLRLTDTPELAGIPWEFLYDRPLNRFLALSSRTPLVRYLDLPDPPRPLRVKGPLRLLVMISNPRDSEYPALDVEREWSSLNDALAVPLQNGRVVVERLTANMAALQQRLRREEFHVFHFIGHGSYRSDWSDGVLIMEDDSGHGHEVTGEELGSLLNDHDATRLAVLNACEGARSDMIDPFAGTAQSLIQQGLPAVVAMQFEITDAAAIIFARELYGAIADGYPLDAALAEARRAIRYSLAVNEWGTPVLYSRAPDGRLFDLRSRAVGGSSASAATSIPQPAQDQHGTATPSQPSQGIPLSAVSVPQAASESSEPSAHAEAAPSKLPGEHEEAREQVQHNIVEPAGRPAEKKVQRDTEEARDAAENGALPATDASVAQTAHDLSAVSGEATIPEAVNSSFPASAAADSDTGQRTPPLRRIRPRLAALMGIVVLAVGGIVAGIFLTGSSPGHSSPPSPSSFKFARALTVSGTGDGVSSVAFSKDGTLATGDYNGSTYLWDAASGNPIRTLADPGTPNIGSTVDSVAFNPDGDTLAVGDGDGSTYLWDVASGNPIRTLPDGNFAEVLSVTFSPDGNTLAAGASNGSTYLWDVHTGTRIRTITDPGSKGVSSVAFSKDGTLATGDHNGSTYLWNATTGTWIRTLSDPGSKGVSSVAFSKDGTLAVGDSNGSTYLWDATTGNPIRTLTGLGSVVAFSPDGNTLAIGGNARTSLWDVATKRTIALSHPVFPNASGVNSVAFSPDGNTLAFSGGYIITYLWDKQ